SVRQARPGAGQGSDRLCVQPRRRHERRSRLPGLREDHVRQARDERRRRAGHSTQVESGAGDSRRDAGAHRSFRMPISDIEEETLDLDWFALDRNGHIGHFTTGGMGDLPQTVREGYSVDSLASVTDFFRTSVKPRATPIVNPALTKYVRISEASS